MSKPISIAFGKSKSVQTSSSRNTAFALRSGLRHDSDDDEETSAPIHESVAGFASDGFVLTKPAEAIQERVIDSAGNGSWMIRRKGGGTKTYLPNESQKQRDATDSGPETATVERNEVSKASGLQFAEPSTRDSSPIQNGDDTRGVPAKEKTGDEVALQALLSDRTGERKSTAVIVQTENERGRVVDETADFRADVASRPDSCTLEEYATMPVEDFGWALLRGMRPKRKADGQLVSYGNGETTKSTASKSRETHQGFLGIGAKPTPGAEVELGAWGKAAMRNKKGEGLYTPVMLRNKRTGEMITEEELEARKRKAREGKSDKQQQGELDWRDRRERNLERGGRDGESSKRLKHRDDHDGRNGYSRILSVGEDSSPEYSRNGSSSRRENSDRDDRYRDSDADRDGKYRDRDRDRRRDRYHRNDDRYDSSSSRRSGHRDRR